MNNKQKLMTAAALATLVGGGLVASNQTQAQAKTRAYSWVKTKKYSNLPYHAKSTKTSAYMWNWNHTKKLHNLKNYPRTTWYLSESVKMVSGSKSGIYYQVTSGNKKTTGYVWRGYLTKGVNPAASSSSTTTTTTGSSTSGTTTTGSTGTSTTGSSNSTASAAQAIENSQMQPLLAYFSGTVEDSRLNTYANGIANMDDEGTDQEDNDMEQLQKPFTSAELSKMVTITNQNDQNEQDFTDLTAGKTTWTQYVDNSLKNANINPANYKGWSIGVGSWPKGYSGDFNGYGTYVIVLLPASTN